MGINLYNNQQRKGRSCRPSFFHFCISTTNLPLAVTNKRRYQGHHMFNVADNPEGAGLAENIQFLEGNALFEGTEHNAAHYGDPHNPTDYYHYKKAKR